MGGKQSKLSEDQVDDGEPQLFAVATPTTNPSTGAVQYIYPVYAAHPPSSDPEKRVVPRVASPSSPPKSWKSGSDKTKSRKRKPVQVVSQQDANAYLSTTQADDGTWYCYHLDPTGHVDYVEPGTAVPSSPSEQLTPHYFPAEYQSFSSPHGPSLSPYTSPGYSYPVAAPTVLQPLPVRHNASPMSAFGYSYQQPISHPPPRARSASPPPRARATSPAPSYRRATTPSPSSPSSYGRAVSPTFTRPSSPPYYAGTPYPGSTQPLSFSSYAPGYAQGSYSSYRADDDTATMQSSPPSTPAYSHRRPTSPSPPSEMSFVNPTPRPPRDVWSQASLMDSSSPRSALTAETGRLPKPT